MMYYITYQTKNLINGKTYVGIHKTSNLEDGYLGSGVLLSKAINKYGKENFKKEILDFHDSYEDAAIEEAFLVNEESVLDDSNYNLKTGGFNGEFYGDLKKEMSERASDNWRAEAFKKRKEVIVRDYETGKYKETINGVRETARRYRTSYRSIMKVIQGERNHHHHLTFKYE